MGVKMIVCDLDGTLLRSDKTISDYTLDMLEKCRKRDILLAFATARSQNGVGPYIDIMRPDALVLNNGALAKIGDKVVYRAIIDVDTANRILALMINHPEVGYITTETEDGYFVNHPIDEHARYSYFKPVFTDFARGIRHDAYKIVPEITAAAAKAIAEPFPEITVTHLSGETWRFFTHKDATKLKGVAAAAKHLGIDLSHVMAFGDDYNDIEMLTSCGIGVAMANAIPEAKAAADYICDDNDSDGVARWIDGNILNGGLL